MSGDDGTTDKQPKTPDDIKAVNFALAIARVCGAECVREHQFSPPRRWRFDFAVPALKIAIEVEGGVFTNGRHVRGVGFMKDMEKYNTATAEGWRLFRTTPAQMATRDVLDYVANLIRCDTKVLK